MNNQWIQILYKLLLHGNTQTVSLALVKKYTLAYFKKDEEILIIIILYSYIIT